MTARGFCAEAALSRNTSGLPRMVCDRMGKSARIYFDVHSDWPSHQRATASSKKTARGIVGDGIDGFGQESAHQHRPCLAVRNAAAAQIEQLLGIEFADRRAVAALHVVGEYLEFRLGIDLGVRRQQQRAVHLITVGALRAARHFDTALEHTARLAVEHIADRLP